MAHVGSATLPRALALPSNHAHLERAMRVPITLYSDYV